jgi:hypothetical protein
VPANARLLVQVQRRVKDDAGAALPAFFSHKSSEIGTVLVKISIGSEILDELIP